MDQHACILFYSLIDKSNYLSYSFIFGIKNLRSAILIELETKISDIQLLETIRDLVCNCIDYPRNLIRKHEIFILRSEMSSYKNVVKDSIGHE